MDASLFSNTPTVTVFDGRGLTVRGIEYHRHPETPDDGTVRITHHRYDGRGLLARSADPRLHEAGLANFSYLTDLRGSALRTRSADAGTSQTLNDMAARPLLAVSSIRTDEHDEDDHSQAVWRTWRYEGTDLPGRLTSVADQVAGEEERISERLLYAGNTAAEKGLNLAGQCVSHYETAGLLHTDSIALTGVPLSVTRRLLMDADNPDIVAHWQGEDVGDWDALLAAQAYITQSQADATGVMLSTLDAAGHQQRMAYDVAGLLAGSWLTLKNGKEQAIVLSMQYSAAGQKLSEAHGNRVVTTYTYEARTQRLTGITAVRVKDAKVLQDLRYAFDPVGNVISVRNDAQEARFWHNQKVVPESTFFYDSLYQLVQAQGREMASAGQQGPQLPPVIVPIPVDNSAYTNYTRTYCYDNAGNLTQIRHSPATGTGYTTEVTISDRSNRGVQRSLTDKPGEVDALFTAGGQQTLLQPGQPLIWTARLELLRVNDVTRIGAEDDRESYRYDSGSQRILKAGIWEASGSTHAQHTLYLPGLELQTKAVGGTQTERLQVIIMGEAGRAQARVLHWEHGKPGELENDQIRYRLDDLVGSSCIELDGEGAILSCEEYYPYGGTAILAARSETEANYKSIRYSGKERDETGLYYYGYRYYQPWAGRWLTVDPAGPVEGLNLFKMVGNSPLTYRDTDGRIRAENAQGNTAPPSVGSHLLAPQKPTSSSPLSAEGVFEKFKDRYGRADSVARRIMAFEILEEVTRNKPDLKMPTPAKNTINGVARKFTLRHYTTATNGQPPFNEIASNFDLVYRGIKKLNRESGSTSNTNPADWAELGNTGFTFFLLAIDGVVSDRGFLSGSSHYAEIDIEEAEAMKNLGLDDVDFFASGDLLPLKNNLQSAKAVRGKLSDLKSILLERTGERGLALKVLQPHQLLQKIESKFDKNFEIKIPGNVKVRTWHKKT